MSRSLSVALFALLTGCSRGGLVSVDQGVDSLITWSEGRITCVAGSICEPHALGALPQIVAGDVSESANAALAYDCDDRWWLGKEQVYAFNVQAPGTLEVLLDAKDELAAFVIAVDEKHTCKGGGAQALEVPVNPGSYWLIVDSQEKTELGDFELLVDLDSPHAADDDFEPNDTHAQSAWIRMGEDEVYTFEALLSPVSPVDYYTFELDPLSSFEVIFEGEGLELEVVTWDSVEPVYVARPEGTHEVYMTDPGLEGWGDPVYATVTVEVRMSREGWEKGGVDYEVRAEHGYAGW